MSERIVTSDWFMRIGEMIIPFLSWTLITMPLWLSPFHPALVAYFIIAFDLYFLYKSLMTAYYATFSFKEILFHSHINYVKKMNTVKSTVNIKHFIVIPNYKEPLYKLESAIKSITESKYPYKNLHLVLAFEARETEAEEKYAKLKNKFGNFFADIMETYHTLQPNEVPGKASNQTFACKKVEEYVKKNNWDQENVVITISDADSHFSSNYFAYLTYTYCKDKDRKYHFYWAPVLLYNNFWQLPFFVRMQATLSSILRLAFVSQREKLIHISTYSTNLWLLNKIDYWDVDIIPEDWHVYYQAFFKFGEKVKTLPLFTLINGDAVYSGNFIKTLLNRYEQEKRWAWGVTDVAFAWKKFFSTPHINPFVKLKKILFLAETHLLWPASFFVLTLSASIPPFINPVFKRTVLGFVLHQVAGLILTIASLMILLYVYLDIKLRHSIKITTKPINVPFLLIQWYLLPVVSFILSSLPALEAHTRLLFGKKITYKVTEKV